MVVTISSGIRLIQGANEISKITNMLASRHVERLRVFRLTIPVDCFREGKDIAFVEGGATEQFGFSQGS